MAKTCLLTLIILSSLVLGALSEHLCSEENLAIKDGIYTLSKGLETGSVLVYHCPFGYYSPVRVRRCLHRKWDPPPKHSRPAPGLQCKLVQCPNPMVFEHGSVLPVQDKYYVNDTTTYECHSNYRFTGSMTRICKANGKWSGTTPICTFADDDCPDPGVPAGTRRTGNFFNVGDKVSYRCEDGLILIGSKERTCMKSREWSGQEPECYYAHTYDTPEDISQLFSGRLKNILSDSTYQQVGKKIILDKSRSVNIYIALDVSDSIDVTYFNRSREFTKRLIEKISYYEVSPRYDIICFATKVIPIVPIQRYYREGEKGLPQIFEDLDSFHYDKKGNNRATDIGGAFQSIHEKMAWMKIIDEDQFQKTSHVIIMFTDGEANMGGNPVHKMETIKSLFNKDSLQNLDIYMFGVGEDVLKDEINRLATHRDKEKHVFLVEDMDTLHRTLDEMLDESTNVGLCGLHRDYRFEDTDTYRPLRQPWLVQIYVRHEEGPSSNCLGSLITPRFILTAAHCFKFGDRKDRIEVTLNSGRAPVKNFILHKEYDIGQKKKEGIPEFYDYDVALIELEETVEITAKTRPICIPCTTQTSNALKLYGADVTCKQHEDILLNKDHVAAFFMSPQREMKNALIKQGAHAKDYCFKKATNAKGVSPGVQYSDLVTERFLCTGGIDPQTDDAACRGDAGGVLFLERNQRSIQVGIVSWGVSDVCTGGHHLSNNDHRDYHINLFKIQPFLKDHLRYELTFLD